MQTTSRVNPEEIVRRAQEWMPRILSPEAQKENHGRYIAVDVETGLYIIGSASHEAALELRAQRPEAIIGVLRIGHLAVGRFGIRVKAPQ